MIYKTMSINNGANMCQEIQPFAEVESPLDAKILRSDKKSWSVAPTSRPQGSGTVFKKSKGKRSLSFISGKHVVNVVTVLHKQVKIGYEKTVEDGRTGASSGLVWFMRLDFPSSNH